LSDSDDEDCQQPQRPTSTSMSQNNQLPVTLVIKEERLAIAEPTLTLLRLVETMGNDIEEEVSKTKETPISKLKRREGSKEIKTEIINSYMNTV